MNPYVFSGQLQQSSMHQQTLWLFSGIALVLIIATLISETLRWRARERSVSEINVAMINTRAMPLNNH
ncbi:phosphatidate cytidylyltransferase, partial [Xanthomonas vesicatoria]